MLSIDGRSRLIAGLACRSRSACRRFRGDPAGPHFNSSEAQTLVDAIARLTRLQPCPGGPGVPAPAYAIDDETAIKVSGSTVDVVSEGHWRLFNPTGNAG
jgi:hypothetical protein